MAGVYLSAREVLSDIAYTNHVSNLLFGAEGRIVDLLIHIDIVIERVHLHPLLRQLVGVVVAAVSHIYVLLLVEVEVECVVATVQHQPHRQRELAIAATLVKQEDA